LHLFELEDGQSASTTVFNLDGQPELEVTIRRNDKTVTVKTQGVGKPWCVLLRGVFESAAIRGGSCSASPRGLLVDPDSVNGELCLELK